MVHASGAYPQPVPPWDMKGAQLPHNALIPEELWSALCFPGLFDVQYSKGGDSFCVYGI